MAEPTEEQEQQAAEVIHERVAVTLKGFIAQKREMAWELRKEAARLDDEAAYIRREALAERWYNLERWLAPEEVETLCSISPVGLLED